MTADPGHVAPPKHPVYALTTFELAAYRQQLEHALAAAPGPATTLEQLRQRLHSYKADHKDAAQHQSQQGKQIENAAQPLPALALWVVEDLFVH